MVTIENDRLKASFITKGAEWRSFVDKNSGAELLWQADAKYWGKSAPVLFPIVGSLRGGQYGHQGASYALPRHGFARDREFSVLRQAADRVTFVLEADDTLRAVFPFEWTFEIEYRLWGATLHTEYRVANRGTGELLFSVGAHPAFNVPLGTGRFEDAYLEFDSPEQPERWMLDAQGTLSGETRRLAPGTKLPLSHALFAEDALVFKSLKSSRVTLRQKGAPSIAMEYPGFPYFGIWSAPDAPFVCLEPWCGIADAATASGKLEEKEGIHKLAPGATFQRSFAVTVEG